MHFTKRFLATVSPTHGAYLLDIMKNSANQMAKMMQITGAVSLESDSEDCDRCRTGSEDSDCENGLDNEPNGYEKRVQNHKIRCHHKGPHLEAA